MLTGSGRGEEEMWEGVGALSSEPRQGLETNGIDKTKSTAQSSSSRPREPVTAEELALVGGEEGEGRGGGGRGGVKDGRGSGGGRGGTGKTDGRQEKARRKPQGVDGKEEDGTGGGGRLEEEDELGLFTTAGFLPPLARPLPPLMDLSLDELQWMDPMGPLSLLWDSSRSMEEGDLATVRQLMQKAWSSPLSAKEEEVSPHPSPLLLISSFSLLLT